jgi:hypothetical protein
MSVPRPFVVLGICVVVLLLANDAGAICKTCGTVANGGSAPTFCTASDGSPGARTCHTFQNHDGSYTCELSGSDCSSGRGSGITCTQTPDPTSNAIDPKNPATLPAGVSCQLFLTPDDSAISSVWVCTFTDTVTDCSGGAAAGGEGASCGKDHQGSINGLGMCVFAF